MIFLTDVSLIVRYYVSFPPPLFMLLYNIAARAPHKLSSASLRIYPTVFFYVLVVNISSCRLYFTVLFCVSS